VKLQKDKVKTHEKDCPNARVPCQASLFGCIETPMRKDLINHTINCSFVLLSKVAKPLFDLNEQIQWDARNLTEQYTLLVRDVGSLIKDHATIIDNAENLSKSFRQESQELESLEATAKAQLQTPVAQHAPVELPYNANALSFSCVVATGRTFICTCKVSLYKVITLPWIVISILLYTCMEQRLQSYQNVETWFTFGM
jgi:hypothetical protein